MERWVEHYTEFYSSENNVISSTLDVINNDGNTSENFSIYSRIKQGCILDQTLFGIFYTILLGHAFGASPKVIYLHTRTNGWLLNLACLCARTKICKTVIRDMLFADDTTIATHTEQQWATFPQACKNSELTLSLKKPNVLGQNEEMQPSITFDNYELEVVHHSHTWDLQ